MNTSWLACYYPDRAVAANGCDVYIKAASIYEYPDYANIKSCYPAGILFR